jgi:hypothetical protein
MMQQSANEARVVMQQAACDVDEVKRSSPLDLTITVRSKTPSLSQGSCQDRTFEIGYPHRTLRRITTLSMVPNTRGPQPGSFRVGSTKNGNQVLLSCGSMGSVRPFCLPFYAQLIILAFSAGSGKSVLWCVALLIYLPR